MKHFFIHRTLKCFSLRARYILALTKMQLETPALEDFPLQLRSLLLPLSEGNSEGITESSVSPYSGIFVKSLFCVIN